MEPAAHPIIKKLMTHQRVISQLNRNLITMAIKLVKRPLGWVFCSVICLSFLVFLGGIAMIVCGAVYDLVAVWVCGIIAFLLGVVTCPIVSFFWMLGLGAPCVRGYRPTIFEFVDDPPAPASGATTSI